MAEHSATFYIALETRDLIAKLSDDFHLTASAVAFIAIAYYRELLDTGTPERPEAVQIGRGSGRTHRVTVTDADGVGAWLAERVTEWETTRGLILTTALGYYTAAIESGAIPWPEPKPGPQPKPEPKPAPKKTTAPKPVRPIGTPTLTDRALCGICHKQVNVDPATSLLVGHIAHASVRPKGVFMNCDGSGMPPAGPVIHGADVVSQTRRFG